MKRFAINRPIRKIFNEYTIQRTMEIIVRLYNDIGRSDLSELITYKNGGADKTITF